MSPQFIIVDGIRLAYLEKNPDGEKTIFFIHGNSSSSHTWQAQFDSKLLSDYRLVAFDLPAHGRSAYSTDYSLPGLGRILATAVGVLAGGREYIIAGVSLGVNIAAEMLAPSIEGTVSRPSGEAVGQSTGVAMGESKGKPSGAPIQPRGMIAIGSCAFGGEYTMEVVFNTHVDMRPSLEDEVSKEELQEYWNRAGLCIHDEDREKYKSFENDYFAVGDNFRSKMFAAATAGRIGEEINLLRQSGVPMLVLFGAEEKVCRIDYLDNAGLNLWQNKVFKIRGAGHFAQIDLPESVNELMSAFAKDVFK